ncbi:hypothetical protein KY329_01425 [Candidatus Woesearchaeota archaeon]|nr:hypothetical protein [Candidatus Woesearchaeota archaeon]
MADVGRKEIEEQLKKIIRWRDGFAKGKRERNLLADIGAWKLLKTTFLGKKLPENLVVMADNIQREFEEFEDAIDMELFGKRYAEFENLPKARLFNAVARKKITKEEYTKLRAERDKIEQKHILQKEKITAELLELHDKVIEFLQNCLTSP